LSYVPASEDREPGRENANGVDLNRDFPNAFDARPKADGFQPETRAVMDWSRNHSFVLSANFHGGAIVVNYPFDNCKKCRENDVSKSPDDETFKSIALSYSLVGQESFLHDHVQGFFFHILSFF
jgi:hypothetical protein